MQLQGVSLNAYNANVDFDVSDNVASISSVLLVSQLSTSTSHTSPGQNGPGGTSQMKPVINTNGFVTNLDDANSVIVTSGVATVSEADAIQEIAKYSGTASDYDITDTATALISAGDEVLNVAGVDIVTASDTSVNANIGGDLAGFTAEIEFDVVDNAAGLIAEMGGADVAGHLTEANSITVDDTRTGSVVNANDGAILAGFTADVGFDVVDDADAIALEVAGASNSGDELNSVDANGVINTVVVSGGDVDATEAGVIQSISGYVGTASDYDITDTATALISAGDEVLNVAGVDIVTASDTSVNANIGGDLAGFTADIEFNVVDNADAIAIEVAASGTGAGSLDEANNVAVVSGDVTASEADAIQDIAKYSGAASDYDITDNAAALISAGDDVLNVAGVDIVTASDTSVNANIGGDLAGFTADIEFDVVDNADAIAIEVAASGTGAGSLDEANNVAVVSGDVTASEADAIQDIAKYSGAASDYDITDTCSGTYFCRR